MAGPPQSMAKVVSAPLVLRVRGTHDAIRITRVSNAQHSLPDDFYFTDALADHASYYILLYSSTRVVARYRVRLQR